MKVRFLTIVLFSIFTLIFNSCSRSKNEVNVYVWSDYLSQDVIEEFEKETGFKVNLDTYDSNEAQLEKLQTGVSKYDEREKVYIERRNRANQIVAEVVSVDTTAGRISGLIGRLAMHPVFGLVFIAFVLYLAYLIIG